MESFIYLCGGIIIGYLVFSKRFVKVKKLLLRDGDSKMVFVVRNDLGMGKGKIAAQCCHACQWLLNKQDREALKSWEEDGCKKIVLKCTDEDDLLNIATKAKASGICHHIVRDAGHTQVDPHSRTVLGLGPTNNKDLSEITGHLKLL